MEDKHHKCTTHNEEPNVLFTVWTWPKDSKLSLYIGVEPFVEFYSITEADIKATIGEQGWHTMDSTDVDALIQGLEQIFRQVKAHQEAG